MSRSGGSGHAILPVVRQILVLSIICAVAGCTVRRLEDIIGPPPAISQSDASGVDEPPVQVAAPSLASGDPGMQEPAAAERAPAIFAAPPINDRAQWQAFHSPEGYDATDAAGTLCSGRVIGGPAGIVKGQRIPLACSDGKSATLKVIELTAGGARGLVEVGEVQQSASITDAAGTP